MFLLIKLIPFLMGFGILYLMLSKMIKSFKEAKEKENRVVNAIGPDMAFELSVGEKKRLKELKEETNKHILSHFDIDQEKVTTTFYIDKETDTTNKVINELLESFKVAGWETKRDDSQKAWNRITVTFCPKKDYAKIRVESEREVEELLKEKSYHVPSPPILIRKS